MKLKQNKKDLFNLSMFFWQICEIGLADNMRDFNMTVSTHQKLGESFYILAKPFTPYHLIYFLNLNFVSPPQNVLNVYQRFVYLTFKLNYWIFRTFISLGLIFEGPPCFRYLKFDINSFVETSRSIKWCPGPGCQRAVRLPDVEVGQCQDTLWRQLWKKRKSQQKKSA